MFFWGANVFKNQKHQNFINNESGFSLLSSLVTLSVIVATSLTFAQATVNRKQAEKRATQSFESANLSTKVASDLQDTDFNDLVQTCMALYSDSNIFLGTIANGCANNGQMTATVTAPAGQISSSRLNLRLNSLGAVDAGGMHCAAITKCEWKAGGSALDVDITSYAEIADHLSVTSDFTVRRVKW